MFIDVGSRISWDGAIDRLAGAASKILPSSNLLHKAVNFMIFKLEKNILSNKNKNQFSIVYSFNVSYLSYLYSSSQVFSVHNLIFLITFQFLQNIFGRDVYTLYLKKKEKI